MTNDSLFLDGIEVKDEVYDTIRDSQEPYVVGIKSFLEELWQKYRPYSDTNFRQQIQIDFDSRFWEMYLVCTLLENNLPVKPKVKVTGPDILIEHSNGRIWIEAIAPTSGSENNPDQVPSLQIGEPTQVPEEQIVLRYGSAISEKFEKKYYKYLVNGVILPADAYVIAINSCKIEAAQMESTPPKILKAVFPIGHRQVTIDKKSKKIVHNGFEPRNSIKRAKGAEVATDLFLNPKYKNLSGIIYSRVGIRKIPERIGEDFVFIHNPLAKNPISHGFLKVGTEYIAYEKANSYEIQQTSWNGSND